MERNSRVINSWRGFGGASFALLVTLVSTAPASIVNAAPNAAEIVRQADEIRFPPTDFQVDVDVRTLDGSGAAEEPRQYRVLSKGNARTLVMTLAPAFEKGQLLLMRDEDLWVFLPEVSQPVRLPLSQKLTGQVANGDLARANFAGDYNAALVGEEVVNGRRTIKLELTASRRGVTYDRVLYWVESDSYRPVKAEFYTRSGRLMKTASYEEYRELGGKVRPTRLVLEDQVGRKQRSVMAYSNLKYRELPEKVFTKQYLKKLN